MAEDRAGDRSDHAEHDEGRGLIHPFSRVLYERDGTGNVRVVDGEKTGRFTIGGEWIDGEIRFADPHMCGWIGGARVRHHRLQVRDD